MLIFTVMADSTVARSQHHVASYEAKHHANPKPVARPIRTRSKSAIRCSNSDDASHDRSFQKTAKPERPSVPPRPNFSKLREVAKRAHNNSTAQPATSSNTRQRQASLESHTKSPGSPRSVGSANALMRPQSISEQLRIQPQRTRSKSSSGAVDSKCSNGSCKQRQTLSNKASDPGLQGHTRTSNVAKVSQNQSSSSPERKIATLTTVFPNNPTAHKQSPARPKPPLPANRPSIPPTASSKPGSSNARQNRRPDRPPTLPKTAAAFTSLSPSKTVPSSLHLYGSTISLPAAADAAVAKGREVAYQPKSFDDSSMRLNGPLSTGGSGGSRCLKAVSSSNGHKTLPKNYGRKSVVRESNRQQVSRKASDGQHGKRMSQASISIDGAQTGSRHSGLNGQRASSTLPRKAPPQQCAKIPPKRPPPAIRDRSRPYVVTNPTLHNSPPQVGGGATSTRYVAFPSANQAQQWQQPQHQLPEDHIYMEVGQVGYQTNASASSQPGESGVNVETGTCADGAETTAEYPYVIMTRADSVVHIYTALTSDTTDETEGERLSK